MQKGSHIWTQSRSAIVSCGPRLISNGLFQSGKVFYGQTSPNLIFLLEITNAVSFGLKRRETFPHVISVQLKSQHPAYPDPACLAPPPPSSPLIAAWTNGSCRGAARPLVSEPLHFSQRTIASLQSHGMLPTRLVLALTPVLLSPQWTALKKRVTRRCLLSTKQWLRTSACPLPLDGRRRSLTPPIPAGRHLPSLDELTPPPGRLPPWLCSRSFRPNSSRPWMSQDLTPQFSDIFL